MHIIEDAEDRQGDQFDGGDQHEVGKGFAQEQGAAGDRGGDEGVQAIVGHLAGEAAVEHQRTGEGEHDPQQAAGHLDGLLFAGIESEAEQHQYDDRKGQGGVDGFLGAEFRAQVFAGDHQRLPEEVHQASS